MRKKGPPDQRRSHLGRTPPKPRKRWPIRCVQTLRSLKKWMSVIRSTGWRRRASQTKQRNAWTKPKKSVKRRLILSKEESVIMMYLGTASTLVSHRVKLAKRHFQTAPRRRHQSLKSKLQQRSLKQKLKLMKRSSERSQSRSKSRQRKLNKLLRLRNNKKTTQLLPLH